MMHVKDMLFDLLQWMFPTPRPTTSELIGFGAEQERTKLRWMVRDCKKHPGEKLVDLGDGRYVCSVCRYEKAIKAQRSVRASSVQSAALQRPFLQYASEMKSDEDTQYTCAVIPALEYVRKQRAPLAAEKTQGLTLTKEQRKRLREVL